MLMKKKIVFLLIILLCLSASIFAQKQSAAKFVESFYEFHRARSGVFSAAEVDVRKRWFTAELNLLFQNELQREAEFLRQNPTDKPYFGDGFPFVPLEECTSGGKGIKSVLKIGKTSANGNRTLVEVKFYQPKACEGSFIHAYKIELAKNENGWLINDLIYPDDKTMADQGRLTADLKREKY